jgi:hypothetical protein
MMAIADQQNRRRARHQQYQSEQARNLAGLIGAVDDVGEEADADAMAKAKAEALASDTGARKTQAEAALLRAKTEAGANADAILRKKTEDSARIAADEAKAAKLAREESVLRRKEGVLDVKRATEGGLSKADLEKRAAEMGVPPEQLLAEADMLNREEMLAADESKAKTAANQALAGQRDAAAAKAARAPTGKGPPKPLTEAQILELKKKRLEIAKLEREAAGDGPKDKVEAGTIKEVGELDATTRGIQDLERRNPGVGTGFFRAVQNSIAQTLGVDDPKATKYRADIANLSNEIISRLSGANVPPAEMERIAQGLPDFGDDDKAFTEKLKATKERVDRARKGLVGAAKAANRDTAGLEAVDPTKPAASSGDAEFDSLPD